MDADGILQVVRDVFGRNWKTEVAGKWVRMACPIARWTHPRGQDTNPSSGISINPSGVSIFNCFTCGKPTPLHGLLRRYSEYTGEDLEGLIEELEDDAYLGPRTLASWDARYHQEEEQLALDKDVFLDLYEPAAGHPYLQERGISDETANRLQLMVDPADPADGEERILFPVFGYGGELRGFSGRATNKEARLKVRDYLGLHKGHNLLGAHLFADRQADKVLVVEGLFDYANAWECGYPAVAVMHSTLTEQQAIMLREIGLPTYLFYDNDEAGAKGVEVAGKALARYQPVMRVRYPKIWVENPSEEGGGHWLKDPGELLAEEFEAMVHDSRLY